MPRPTHAPTGPTPHTPHPARRIASAVLLLLILGFLLAMLANLYPLMRSIAAHQGDEHPMIEAIDAFGANGVLILAAVQALQVVTVFFPAVAVQMLGGLVYGILGGFLVCLAGYLLGNLAIYLLVREFRITLFPSSRKQRTARFPAAAAGSGGGADGRPAKPAKKSAWDFSFLRDSDSAFVVSILLFLIPGVPNAVLSYLLAGTRIGLPRFLLCCLCGAPTILLSCLVGQQLGQGDVAVGVVAFSVLVAASFVVYLLRAPLLAGLRRFGRGRRRALSATPADAPPPEPPAGEG